MKLEDVQKMSTSGQEGTVGPVRVEHEFNLVDATGSSLTGLSCSWVLTQDRNKANAALLAHWWNHTPKLLEALRLNAHLYESGPLVSQQTADAARTATLEAIKAASEVEGI